MSESQTASVKEAAEILGGRNSWNGDDLRKLERRLAKEQQDELARRIRLLRAEADVKLADALLGGESATPPDMLKLAKRLAEYKRIGLARRIMKRARAKLKRTDYPNIYVEIFQKSALYTYKDPDLPLEWRLDAALEILGEAEDLAHTESQETLGLAGAIYKRKWEVDGLRQNLERALFYYVRGYALGIRDEHVEADEGKAARPPAADRQAALKAVRADVVRYLRENPDCRLWADDDRGYCGINASFVLDLLAHEEQKEAERAGLSSIAADERREAARLIREEIKRSVPPLLRKAGNEWLAEEWWFYATVGEAYFGLGQYEPEKEGDPPNYDMAVRWLVDEPAQAGLKIRPGLETPAGLEVPEWEHESTARQLARLARLQCDPAVTEEEFAVTEAGRTLARFLRDDEKAVSSTFRGKFGLGLSGGGFRASLFHIGVLARLAELDVLRHVEVLSCVSGGSIIGAHYYLEVRKLLQTKTDDQITRDDYIEIVKRVERDFLAGVQRNIRTRVLAEWVTNLRMLFLSGYTRTLRVGELYERELFSKVEDVEEKAEGGGGKDGGRLGFRSPVTGPKWLPDWLARRAGWRRDERWLNDLYIEPLLADGSRQKDFNPRSHNWRRQNKAPILVLNAASLNTGHNWQFTASFMGEPPAPLNTDMDSNYRLRRMYYEDAPPQYRRFRLGHAVAASSCVPGLFEPLRLDGLYPDDDGKLKDEQLISVRLVDGGACDNQGIASLLEQDCTVMLISDASGQMEAENVPGGGPLGVVLRTTNVVQARVREAQYTDVAGRRRSALLRGLMFIHLRQDLPGGEVTWKDCPSSLKESDFESALGGADDSTSYGVAADVQRKLAAVRTDLDSFSDAEAYALMTSAYRMTAEQFEGEKKCVDGFPPPPREEDWCFLAVERAMKPGSAVAREERQRQEKERRHLERLLDAAGSAAFKIWKLSPVLRVLKYVLLAAVLCVVVWLFYALWDTPLSPPAIYARVAPYLPEFVKRYVPALTFGFVGEVIIWAVVIALAAAAANRLLGKKLGRLVIRGADWRGTLRDVAIGVGMSTLGFIAARLHLHVFDPLYLRYGKLDKFPK